MLWMPPPSWFIVVLIGGVVHIGTIAFIFVRCGWIRGLIAISIGAASFILGTALGLIANLLVAEIAPLPMIMIFAGLWWLPLDLGLARPG